MGGRLGVVVDNKLAAWSGNRVVGKAACMVVGKVAYMAVGKVAYMAVGKVVDKAAAVDMAVGTVADGNQVEDKEQPVVALRHCMAVAVALAARLQAVAAVAWGVPSQVVESVA